jgi:hypothetical protein
MLVRFLQLGLLLPFTRTENCNVCVGGGEGAFRNAWVSEGYAHSSIYH